MSAQTIPINLLDGDTLLLDNSSMELFQTCQRAAQYGIAERRRGASSSSALHFGGIVHKAMEVRYRSCSERFAQTDQVTNVMVATVESEFTRWSPPEGDFRNLDCAVNLIHRYGERYPFEEFDQVVMPDGRPFVEQPFCFPLTVLHVNATMLVQTIAKSPEGQLVKVGDPKLQHVAHIKVLWIGRLDLVYTSHNGLYIMDHKTSSMATNMAEFEIAHQFYGYTAAVEEILGVQVAGTVINRIVCRKPTRTGEPFTFERKLIPTNRDLLAEWRRDMTQMVTDYVVATLEGYFPKQTAWCVGKFGTCQYHKVCCLGDETQRRFMLGSGEYEENVWSPLT